MSLRQSPNLLARETSPYLLQHAWNPVNWQAWGPEALAQAQAEDKPIFLSVGYSACHWCHVMEKESFEDAEVGRCLNAHFIAIKVDREERPDIDDIYMTAVQTMTGSGGWPMSVFLTPAGEPFYAGTYFPKDDQYGRPGFLRVLESIANHWKKDAAGIRQQGVAMAQALQQQLERDLPRLALPTDLLEKTVRELEGGFDSEEGGFGSAPKFPCSMALDLYSELLCRPSQLEPGRLLGPLRLSLRKMAQGGMYDQVGGGFHRYSTDEEWYVPHFEKMLYDNALLAGTYLRASLLMDGDFNRRIGREILDYVLREMRHPAGAFYSTTDADSEGLEGRYFLWTRAELADVLGQEDAAAFAELYNIRVPSWSPVTFPGGTPPHSWFAGRIPCLSDDFEVRLASLRLAPERVEAWRVALRGARAARPPPLRDEKVLASWNGLMVSALAEGHRLTGEQAYLEAARAGLEFLWENLQRDGRLFATWKDGRRRHNGTLEDYANVADACLALHQTGGGGAWLARARELAESAARHFADAPGRAFFYTAADAERLIVRSKNPHDGAVPGANSVLAGVFSRLARLTGERRYFAGAQGIFAEFSAYMTGSARGFPRLILEHARATRPGREAVLIAAPAALRAAVAAKLGSSDLLLTEADSFSPLLADKTARDGPTLYLCRDGACELPVIGAAAILRALD